MKTDKWSAIAASMISGTVTLCAMALVLFCPAALHADQADPPTAAAEYGATLSPKMPDGAIVVPAADGALSTAIKLHGTDTTFFISAGVHSGNDDMRPKAGSVFIGEAGAILDGGNTIKRCFTHDGGFEGGLIAYRTDSPRYVVTLRNLIIRRYASDVQDCAVNVNDTGQGWNRALSDPGDRNGWLIDHCTFTDNRAGGLTIGSASTAQNCLFSDNDQIGVKATGSGMRLLNCRATNNNKDLKVSYFFEAGGTKFWNSHNMLIDGGEFDHNGGSGLWFDYNWDGNIIRNVHFHDNLRAGLEIEMTAGVEVTGCTFSNDDIHGITGAIPAEYRPWDKSPKSGPTLWCGEVFLFNSAATGTFVSPVDHSSHEISGKTWIHANKMVKGNGGVNCLYQDRGHINPSAQMVGDTNGPVAGLKGIVIEDNDVNLSAGYAGVINILANRDYQKEKGGPWGPIPAEQAKEQYEGVKYSNNRYSGTDIKFNVAKAATMTGDNFTIWDWDNRITIDLAQWQALGHDAIPAYRL